MVDKGVNSLRSDSLVGNKYMQDYLSIAIKIFAGFRYDSSDEDIRLADNAEEWGLGRVLNYQFSFPASFNAKASIPK